MHIGEPANSGLSFCYSSKNNQAMREQLIRYLLGELDADERRELRSQLKSDPELRAELEQLRSCFAASQDEDLYAPDAPMGLASRTSDLVANSDEFGPSIV